MKKLAVLMLMSGQAAAHSGAGTPDALFHVHGAEYVGLGLLALAVVVALPALGRFITRRFRA